MLAIPGRHQTLASSGSGMRAAAFNAVAAARTGRRLLRTPQAASVSPGLAYSAMTDSGLPSTQLSEFTQRQLGSDVIDFSAGQASPAQQDALQRLQRQIGRVTTFPRSANFF
jgi:hypothetical protein